MPLMAPQPQQPNPESLPAEKAPMAAIQSGMTPGNIEPSNKEMGVEEDVGPTDEEIQAHLDNLPDEGKAFLAEHLTPEFVTAIGLISGDKVAQYLMQYADQDKVLVPVPRKEAEAQLAAMKGATPQGGQPQGQPSAPPQAMPAPAQPPQGGGMMAPMQPATPR